MLKRISVVLVALLLAGCILQARAPLYRDAEARLVFGDRAKTAQVFSKKDGAWVADNESVTLMPEGHHYVVNTGKSVMTLSFIPLKGYWHVVQAMEKDHPPVYLLASLGKLGAEFRLLACADLKKNGKLRDWISHEGDDCFVTEKAPLEKLFKAALAMPGETTSRLTFPE